MTSSPADTERARRVLALPCGLRKRPPPSQILRELAAQVALVVENSKLQRLNRVVGSFLDYARPSRGDASAIDVNDAVQKTVAITRNDLPAGVTLHLETNEALPPVRIDPEHLRQVVMNLVRNAVEAMEGRGEIAVMTQLHAGAATMVEIVVRDNGPGIAPKVLPNLFIPFFTTKAQGTGLGLAICQRLIASAGGRIEVRTQGGQGTTFVVMIPAVDGKNTTTALYRRSPRRFWNLVLQPDSGGPSSISGVVGVRPVTARSRDTRRLPLFLIFRAPSEAF